MSFQEESRIRVSVFCLAYNHEKYIRKTLDGFVNQKTNFRFEVLIHDDASTDQTQEIIQEYAGNYPELFHVVLQKENQYGQGINIVDHMIVPLLEGDYIAICEGDDYWQDPYKLQKQFDVMESHPECSLCTHLVQCCNEDGTRNERVIPEPMYRINASGVIHARDLKYHYWIGGGYPFHTSSYFYRRTVALSSFESPRDIGILRKCLVFGDCYFINEKMSVRRLWSIGNWNSRMAEQGIKGRYELMLSDLAYENEFDQYTEYKYHDYIVANRFMRLMGFAYYYIAEVRNDLKKYNIRPKILYHKVSLGRFLRYEMEYFFVMKVPLLYISLKRIWKCFRTAMEKRD